MFNGGAAEKLGEPCLHGVVDIAFAALAIDRHALLQHWSGPAEQHLMKRPMVLQPAPKILLLFILAQLAQKLGEFFEPILVRPATSMGASYRLPSVT